MPKPVINEDECSGCGTCVDGCPNGVLELVGDYAKVVHEEDCNACGTCAEECPMEAVEVEED